MHVYSRRMNPTALAIDSCIIVVYFVGITLIGIYEGRRERSLLDYALGGRRIPWWAVMASIIAAEVSAATFIGAPAEGYSQKGLAYVQLVLGLIIGRVLVGHIFLRPYYVYRVYTVYDFLAIRFGPLSKNYISALFLFMRVLASGVRLYVPSLVMVLAWRLFWHREAVQFEVQDSWVPYAWAIGALTFITCIYTTLGGIKAVIWTDLIQATLMFSSALVAIGTLFYHIGGIGPLLEHVPTMKTTAGYFRTGFENLPEGFLPWVVFKKILEDPYTLFAAVIATTFTNMAAFGTDQDMVQRMLTAEDYKRSRRSLISAALMDVPIATAFTFIGVLLIAFYAQHPELKPEKINDIFGQYILSVMPPVVRGFVLAGVFATAMRSLSPAQNALATTATNDWYLAYFGKGKGDAHQVAAARIFTALFAVLMVLIAVAFAYANVKNPRLTIIPIALGVAGYILGPMLGVFLLGMLTKRRGSDAGNVIAVTCGLLAIFLFSGLAMEAVNWLAGAPVLSWPAWLPRVAFTWYVMVGGLVTFVVGALFPTPAHVVESAERR
ncbi:sodium:proline symporter [bacterium]|nr:sodium:proline symporter [bacterium]